MIIDFKNEDTGYELPEESDWDEFEGFEQDGSKKKEIRSIKPSRFIEFSVRMPVGGEAKRFSFKGRRYLRTIYDSPAKRKLLLAGRQVEKSTLLGNTILTYSAVIPFFRSLYVSPSHTQTKVFSRDRIKEPIEISPVLGNYTNTRLLSNVLEKKFTNKSQVTLRFAFLNADRCRGIPADYINIDEFQDIILDNIPVIEECASHSCYRMFTYSGTPKSLDGSLEYYWARYSTQNEWVVPCRKHGTPKKPGSWHWNVLDEENIGPYNLICDECGGDIDAQDPDAQWASMNPDVKAEKVFEGYRIPQIMVPWIGWPDILFKQKNYSRAKFYNEVLGRSYDSGTRPLRRQDIVDNCNKDLSMRHFEKVANYRVPVFMGIDWGTGEGTYTVITLGGYLPFAPDKFTIFYAHRFEGLETDPELQLKEIKRLVTLFRVMQIGVDYGGGHWPNDRLIREYGSERLKRYQWVGNVRHKIKFDPSLGVPRFLCHRTEIMSDVFNAIKRRDVFRFPRWEEWEEPYGKDFLNIFSEYNERLRMNVYSHAPGMPDDTAHSSIYCFLASFYHRKRPDVILPTKDVERESSNYSDLDIDT